MTIYKAAEQMGIKPLEHCKVLSIIIKKISVREFYSDNNPA